MKGKFEEVQQGSQLVTWETALDRQTDKTENITFQYLAAVDNMFEQVMDCKRVSIQYVYGLLGGYEFRLATDSKKGERFGWLRTSKKV